MSEGAVIDQPQASLPLVAPATPAPKPAAAPKAPPKGRYEIPTLADLRPEAPKEPITEAPNKAELAPATEPEGKPDEEVTQDEQAERARRRDQNKLEKAYRKRAEEKARADQLEKTLAEERAKNAPRAPEGEPKLEQFDYDPEKYAKAVAEYTKKQAEKEFETKQRTESEKAATQRLASDWEEKADRGAEKYPDWNEKVGELKPESPLLMAIMEAENGDDVAHYLASNRKEAQRISGLPLISQIREIGRLEQKLLSEPEKPKAPSKAPAPITPLKGAATPVSDTPSENDDMRDWMRKRNKQVSGRR